MSAFLKLIYYTHNIYKVYKDKLQNCSCNQFHFTGTYKQVEKNIMTKNRGGNDGSEKWIEKNTAATDRLIEAVHGSYEHGMRTVIWLAKM